MHSYLCAILLCLSLILLTVSQTQANTIRSITLETDLAAAAQPYKRVGYDLEIWPGDNWAIGTAFDRDGNLSTRNFLITSDNNQPYLFRLFFSNFFIKIGALESQVRILKKSSSNLTGTTPETKRKAVLKGSRVSLGYWIDFEWVYFTVGFFSESVSTETFVFNDGSKKTIGGQKSGPILAFGFEF